MISVGDDASASPAEKFAQPVTVFYDRTGKQVDQVSGPVSTADLAAGIAKASG